MSTEETITVTLPLRRAKDYLDYWNQYGGPSDPVNIVVWKAIKAGLPEPKSPERVICDVLMDPFYPETVMQRAKQVRDALGYEGWLRDTPAARVLAARNTQRDTPGVSERATSGLPESQT